MRLGGWGVCGGGWVCGVGGGGGGGRGCALAEAGGAGARRGAASKPAPSPRCAHATPPGGWRSIHLSLASLLFPAAAAPGWLRPACAAVELLRASVAWLIQGHTVPLQINWPSAPARWNPGGGDTSIFSLSQSLAEETPAGKVGAGPTQMGGQRGGCGGRSRGAAGAGESLPTAPAERGVAACTRRQVQTPCPLCPPGLPRTCRRTRWRASLGCRRRRALWKSPPCLDSSREGGGEGLTTSRACSAVRPLRPPHPPRPARCRLSAGTPGRTFFWGGLLAIWGTAALVAASGGWVGSHGRQVQGGRPPAALLAVGCVSYELLVSKFNRCVCVNAPARMESGRLV